MGNPADISLLFLFLGPHHISITHVYILSLLNQPLYPTHYAGLQLISVCLVKDVKGLRVSLNVFTVGLQRRVLLAGCLIFFVVPESQVLFASINAGICC